MSKPLLFSDFALVDKTPLLLSAARRLFIVFVLSILVGGHAMATHLRAGNITALRISQTSFRYRFTLVIYRDTEFGVQVGNGTFNFGDGRIVAGLQAMTAASVSGFRETALANFHVCSVSGVQSMGW